MRWAPLAVLLVSAAARAESFNQSIGWKPPTTAEWVMLTTVEGLIVVDVMQTRYFLKHGNGELNPLIGPTPSESRLIVLGALGGLATATLFYALPTPWRDLFLAGVGGAEVGVIISNNDFSLRFRF